jgi:hypothetical protein
MSYDPRTIAYMAEIIYQPIQLQAKVVQGIHNALFAQPQISYQNFQVGPDGIHMSNPPESPGSVSMLSFGLDRLVFREELRGMTVEDFATRLVNVASIALRALGVGSSLAQQFVVRSLVTPRQVNDSREFLLHRVIQAPEEAWGQFKRPMQRVGLAFTFPQVEQQEQVYNLRIETWTQDPRSLWIENVGSFTKPVPTERLPDLSNYLFATYRFVTGPTSNFLHHFDR